MFILSLHYAVGVVQQHLSQEVTEMQILDAVLERGVGMGLSWSYSSLGNSVHSLMEWRYWSTWAFDMTQYSCSCTQHTYSSSIVTMHCMHVLSPPQISAETGLLNVKKKNRESTSQHLKKQDIKHCMFRHILYNKIVNVFIFFPEAVLSSTGLSLYIHLLSSSIYI